MSGGVRGVRSPRDGGGRSVLGGYAEAQARYERVDGIREQLGFEARRFNLFANARVSDFVRLGAEVEDGGREISLEFAAIDVRVHAAFTLRAGMLLSPIGRFNLAHDSPLNEFTDRPLVSTQLLGVALSEPGVGAFGQFRTRSAGRITYEAYATNGFHDGLILDPPEGTRVARGSDNFEDNKATPSFVGRLAWSAGPAWELGISAHVGPFNNLPRRWRANRLRATGQHLGARRRRHVRRDHGVRRGSGGRRRRAGVDAWRVRQTPGGGVH